MPSGYGSLTYTSEGNVGDSYESWSESGIWGAPRPQCSTSSDVSRGSVYAVHTRDYECVENMGSPCDYNYYYERLAFEACLPICSGTPLSQVCGVPFGQQGGPIMVMGSTCTRNVGGAYPGPCDNSVYDAEYSAPGSEAGALTQNRTFATPQEYVALQFSFYIPLYGGSNSSHQILSITATGPTSMGASGPFTAGTHTAWIQNNGTTTSSLGSSGINFPAIPKGYRIDASITRNATGAITAMSATLSVVPCP